MCRFRYRAILIRLTLHHGNNIFDCTVGVLNDLEYYSVFCHRDEKIGTLQTFRATNIILQGLPKDIYSLINHYTDAKDIWDNVKMLLEGSELTKEDRESQLYDDFEHFRQNKGETIHDYYVKFAWGGGELGYGGAQKQRWECYSVSRLRQDLSSQCGSMCFKLMHCDAYDSDVDEAPTAQTMFMANLSSADPVYDEAGPSYDSDILSEVQDHDHFQDAICEHHEEHGMQDDVQPSYVVDSHADYTSDSNMTPYDQYVKDNAVQL
ncbi:hypothetical protein Tco_0044671 [Tanacetum coccineum]